MNNLTTGEKIVGAASVVLLIAFFLPWFNYGIGSVNGFRGLGILALLLLLAVAAAVLLPRLGNVKLPNLPIKWSDAVFYGGLAVLLFTVLNFLMKPFGGPSWSLGAWLGLIAAAGVAYGTFLVKKEGGPAVAAGGTGGIAPGGPMGGPPPGPPPSSPPPPSGPTA